MLLGDAATQRLAKLRWRGLDSAIGKACQLTGLGSPAISAAIIARPLLPITSESTESSLMLASSRVFCTR
jgi:hypothetical protein